MSANPITGLNTTVSLGDGVSSALVALHDIVDVSFPFGQVNMIEYSTLTQSDRQIRLIEGMIHPESCNVEMIYNQADYARLVAVKGLLKNWQIVIPTDNVATNTAAFSGAVVKCDFNAKNSEIIMLKFEIKLSGVITLS